MSHRWKQAAGGEGRVVLLSGEPGIGKSRLTIAFQEQLQSEPHTRLRYFCSPHDTDTAFYPSITQVERAAGFERRDTLETELDRLTLLLGSLSHENDIQLLADLLSIPTDGVPLFVEELTKAVLEAASQDEVPIGALSKTSNASLAVPSTLYAYLMARIDRLGAATKENLRALRLLDAMPGPDAGVETFPHNVGEGAVDRDLQSDPWLSRN